ncbi:MAG: M23 family metallopeptidase [Candidatus Nanopelagicales bacterium]
MRRIKWVSGLFVAMAALASFAAPALADDPTPSPSDSVTASPSESASASPSPEPTTSSPTPTTSQHPTKPGPSATTTKPVATYEPWTSSPTHTSQQHAYQRATAGRSSAPTGADPFLIDVANDTLAQATRKARAAFEAATAAQKLSRQARVDSRQSAAALARAERAAAAAQTVLGQIARTLYAYNLDFQTLQDPSAMTWLAPLNVDSADFVKRSAQLSHIADNLAQRYERAQLSLQGAEATRATAEQATADAAVSVKAAKDAKARALSAQKAAHQVFERVSHDGGGGADEAWWANESAGSDLGEMLARLTGGPRVALHFRQPGSGVVTSGYGMRMHPILHVYKLHTGIDYAVGDGKIRAAKAGKVVRAGYDVAYGNYVVILHGQFNGRSVATLYAHSAALYVHQGDRVATGDVLGLVGATGYATGAHLHFEVRLDGRPVNPAPFLH